MDRDPECVFFTFFQWAACYFPVLKMFFFAVLCKAAPFASMRSTLVFLLGSTAIFRSITVYLVISPFFCYDNNGVLFTGISVRSCGGLHMLSAFDLF